MNDTPDNDSNSDPNSDPNSDDPAQWRHERVRELIITRAETRENIRELRNDRTTIDIECGHRKVHFKGSYARPTAELKKVLADYLETYDNELTVELALLGHVS